MEWWRRKIKLPVRKVWNRFATRLGIRESGLPKLQRDVRTCEYEDVHVMWGMLNPSGKSETIRLGGREKKKRSFSNFFDWVKRPPSICRAF